jgi:hypothetical protein
MFDYAMYLAVKEAHPNEKVLCTNNSFKGYGLHNGYELERIFNIKIDKASLWQLAKVAYPFFNYKSWQIMRHILPKRKSMTLGTTQIPFNYSEVQREDSVFYDGYWQNEKNFMNIRSRVLDAFTFSEFESNNNKKLSTVLKEEISVSCHIRRGDYLLEPNFCVCTPDYYERAIALMNERVNPSIYCIFSDDIAWCKENISTIVGNRRIVFVDWNKGENSYRDMQLMSLCKHNIIANSSFSWWGAWLNQNPNKVVMAPELWMRNKIVNNPICDNWVKIRF